jgi:hypothetical protein
MRRFLTAEEVPRWFGLALVVIYFVGLMTASQYALSATRAESAGQFRQNASYAVKLLSDRLAAMERSEGEGPWAACNRVMKEFSASLPAERVRVVSGADRKVICSSDPGETGRAAPVEGESIGGWPGMETLSYADEAGQRHWLIRSPVTPRAAGAAAPGAGPSFVEAVVLYAPPIANQWCIAR